MYPSTHIIILLDIVAMSIWVSGYVDVIRATQYSFFTDREEPQPHSVKVGTELSDGVWLERKQGTRWHKHTLTERSTNREDVRYRR